MDASSSHLLLIEYLGLDPPLLMLAGGGDVNRWCGRTNAIAVSLPIFRPNHRL